VGAMKKSAVAFVAMLLIIAAGYGAVRAFAALAQGYSWNEMDWNHDGSTSLSEFIQSSDIGKRTVTKDGKMCTEYFRMKDGMSVRVDCAAGQQRLP